jgi:hypothetical protein
VLVAPIRSGCAHLVEGTSPAPGKATPNPLLLRHTAVIAGLYVALLDVGPSIGMRCEAWLRDEMAWEEWSPTLGRAKHLRPDAYVEVSLEVDGEVGRGGAFVEVDFATMDQPRLRAKVARHRDYASERAWWDRHPGCPAFLLLTTSEARVTRFLVNVERDRPRQNRYDGDDHEFDWEELVAAATAVGSPDAALSAPVWLPLVGRRRRPVRLATATRAGGARLAGALPGTVDQSGAHPACQRRGHRGRRPAPVQGRGKCGRR